MSISSMHGRFPFFSLGTSAKYFKEKIHLPTQYLNTKNILAYFSYKMRSPWLICLKNLTYKYIFFDQKCEISRVVQHYCTRL